MEDVGSIPAPAANFNTMEKLTKENFFNEMQFLYPDGMKVFRAWIDQYKKDNDWFELFGDRVKYHHLPAAMQAGIFFLFIQEYAKSRDEHFEFDFDLKYEMAVVFKTINEDMILDLVP